MRRIAATAALAWALLPEGMAMSDQTDPRLGELFRRLSQATSAREAAPIEHAIWTIWLEVPRGAVAGEAGLRAQAALEQGLRALDVGDLVSAARAFDEVVEQAPDFAEGFNKRATVRFLMGSLNASVRDIERTLALEPRHFGALSGLALIREAEGRWFDALEALEPVARLHPQLPGLQARIDRLTRELGEPI